ncbi:hypothetical protein KUCAC02_012003 [Chaenocephalus aceratus]|uniref:Uncharacterized protein n=1 Tax=Chaenocephalus aceratus TaxID=36190 RepID=A0ACB9XBB4_CHAAC|nr:hypothetical protein KUCAC02_012003 [Chaenocephalus aceratus]
MKAHKPTQVKGHAKSQKWKDVRGKRSRPPITSSELNSSPVVAKMATNTPQSVVQKPPTQANGSSVFKMDNDSNDSMEWKKYSQSIHGNGVKTSGEIQHIIPVRLEGGSLHNCAERDDRRNHAVLVMQKNQTLCFRGKCHLTCLYGRVEVMGALENSDQTRDDKTEASPILKKYLTSASRKKLLKNISVTVQPPSE